ncbi:hypothetical protein F383_34692 [Gossypium arboreum]|uniref:Uncharacterized protein n=1 Tax=Gossypium arboreum TaxID=29729 RepID=A0A0B0PRZ8_GOSAR|nr:hypothetical protein F383_34692 [Gossypium arboreum]
MILNQNYYCISEMILSSSHLLCV